MIESCYVHIPFCAATCSYCDFYKVIHKEELERRFVAALQAEIALLAAEHAEVTLETLYFGGGTPSVLSKESWRLLFGTLKEHFKLSPTCEITVEANPESATEEKIETLAGLGVNRLSLGAQSFRRSDLALLSRIHSSDQIGLAVTSARKHGIENISLDLIYGLPDESEISLPANIEAALTLEPQHLSLYALTLEGGVPLELAVEKGKANLPADDDCADHYLAAVRLLSEAGLQQYEISNFALSGFECRHNLNYWQQRDYLGFGPAAVSTVADKRVKNVEDLDSYVERLTSGKQPMQESERLDERTRLTERIMLSLRLKSGLDAATLKRDFDYDILEERSTLISDLRSQGDLLTSTNRIALTPQGMLRLNGITQLLLPTD